MGQFWKRPMGKRFAIIDIKFSNCPREPMLTGRSYMGPFFDKIIKLMIRPPLSISTSDSQTDSVMFVSSSKFKRNFLPNCQSDRRITPFLKSTPSGSILVQSVARVLQIVVNVALSFWAIVPRKSSTSKILTFLIVICIMFDSLVLVAIANRSAFSSVLNFIQTCVGSKWWALWYPRMIRLRSFVRHLSRTSHLVTCVVCCSAFWPRFSATIRGNYGPWLPRMGAAINNRRVSVGRLSISMCVSYRFELFMMTPRICVEELSRHAKYLWMLWCFESLNPGGVFFSLALS